MVVACGRDAMNRVSTFFGVGSSRSVVETFHETSLLPYYDSPTDFGTSRLEPRPYSHLEDGIVAGVQLEKSVELLAHAHPYRCDVEGK